MANSSKGYSNVKKNNEQTVPTNLFQKCYSITDCIQTGIETKDDNTCLLIRYLDDMLKTVRNFISEPDATPKFITDQIRSFVYHTPSVAVKHFDYHFA